MSQENAQRIQELELLRKQDREAIALAEKWEKLKKHPLFKELVLENYLDKLAIQLVHGFTNPTTGTDPADVSKAMIGISELKQYIDHIPNLAVAAKLRTSAGESELDYLRGEE